MAAGQQQHQQQLQQGEQQAVELEEYFRQHAADEWLVSGLAGVEQQLQQLQHHHQRLQLQEQARQQTEHRLAETRQQLEQQRTHWTQARDSLQQGQDELVSQQARLTELLAGRLLPEYRREREHLLDKRTLLARIQSLEEQRQQLHEGQPCPLCGSESHPYADGQIPQPDQLSEQIQALEQLIERIEQQQDSCRQQEQAVQLLQTAFAEAKTVGLGLSTRLEGLQDNLDEQCKAVDHLEQQLVEYQQQTNAALVPLGMQLTEQHNAAGLLQLLQQRQVRWQQQLGLQQQLQQDRQQHVAEITLNCMRTLYTACNKSSRVYAAGKRNWASAALNCWVRMMLISTNSSCSKRLSLPKAASNNWQSEPKLRSKSTPGCRSALLCWSNR